MKKITDPSLITRDDIFSKIHCLCHPKHRSFLILVIAANVCTVVGAEEQRLMALLPYGLVIEFREVGVLLMMLL